MSITAAYVKNVAPEFASETDQRVDDFIGYAAPYINRTTWGAKSDFAHALYTAHLLKSSGGATGPSATGPITQEKVGDLSVSYGAPTISAGDISATAYGNTLLQLRKTLMISPMVVR